MTTLQLDLPEVKIYESALMRTVTTVIIGHNYLLVVDPNWLPEEVDYLYQQAEQLREDRTGYLLFTHSDYDHIIGYGKFADRYKAIASRAFVDNPGAEAQLTQIREFDDAYYLSREYPITYPTIDRPISGDGTQLMLDNDEYVFYQAAGHNFDGIITHDKTRGILIVGDYLSNVEFPFIYHSVSAYRDTLDKLRAIINRGGVKLLVTGHGDHTTDMSEMQRRLDDSSTYIDELTASVTDNKPFDLDRLLLHYSFPSIMRKFHAGNLETLRRELS